MPRIYHCLLFATLSLFLIILFILPPVPMFAQNLPEIDLKQLMIDKRAIVKETMQFNQKEGAIFWPVYDEIEAKHLNYFNRYKDMLDVYMRERANLTDEKAKALTQTLLDLQAEQLKFKQAMVKKLSRKLPHKRVYQYLVLEERIDAGFLALIAEELPPIK